MEMKNLILIGGGLLIAIVVAHGLWITWRARRDPLKLRIDERLIAAVGEREPAQTEFPNGGARVVERPGAGSARSSAERAPRMEPELPRSSLPVVSVLEEGLADDEPVPAPRAAAPGSVAPAVAPSAPVQASASSAAAAAAPVSASAPAPSSAGASARKPPDSPMVREPAADDASRRGASAARRAQDALRALGKAASGRSAGAAPRPNGPTNSPPTREPVAGDGGPEELILINVLAPREQPFTGTQVIEALRANALRYGEMNIFHRIDAESRVIQFSIANIIEPGTFDLSDIEAFRSPGLCFFLRLPGPESPIDAFDDMQRTARDVAQRLSGELKDERRSVLTAQTIEHYRGRVAEYCRRRMSMRA